MRPRPVLSVLDARASTALLSTRALLPLFLLQPCNSLSSLKMLTGRELLQSKIKEALIYWDKVCASTGTRCE